MAAESKVITFWPIMSFSTLPRRRILLVSLVLLLQQIKLLCVPVSFTTASSKVLCWTQSDTSSKSLPLRNGSEVRPQQRPHLRRRRLLDAERDTRPRPRNGQNRNQRMTTSHVVPDHRLLPAATLDNCQGEGISSQMKNEPIFGAMLESYSNEILLSRTTLLLRKCTRR